MGRKIRKHFKNILPIKKPVIKEVLRTRKGNIPLNIAQTDRISFSVLRNDKNKLRKIENISYEIYIEDRWEWVVRYDDHGGLGTLHRHDRVSLRDQSEVESEFEFETRFNNKNEELSWVCNDIQDNYLEYREKILRNIDVDLY